MEYRTEKDIKKAGGRLAENYSGLKNYLDGIDNRALPFLCAIGMATDKVEYLKNCHKQQIEIRQQFVSKQVDLIARKVEEAVRKADSEGREGNYKGIPIIEKYASSYGKHIPLDSDILHDGEKLRKKINQKIVQKLNADFNEIFIEIGKREWRRYEYTYKNPGEDIFFDAIRFTPDEGLSIDIPTFAEIYRSHTEAEKSETHRKHMEAAEAVNAFFGNLPIDERELKKSFVLYGGKLKPNPASVNVESYMRVKW